ncbi:hypothetical protein R6Q57_004240 [Mikania cordata]
MDPFPYPFHQSLLDHTTTVTDATTTAAASTYTVHAPKSVHPNTIPDVIFGLIMISFISTIAIWANHEASKGFSITIINEAGKHSLAGKRFSVFYESNDKATRTVINTSRFIEYLLYPNQDFQRQKKQINSVTLKLAAQSFPAIVSVESQKAHEYMIILSASLMESSYKNDAFVLAVLQGMARVWLWDGEGSTPAVVLNGMVEYISTLAGFRSTEIWSSIDGATMSPENDEICWKVEDPRKVAGFLRFHDQRMQPGGGGGYGGGEVVRRLNDGMRDGWHDMMMDDALGMEAGQHVCESYDN